MSRYIGQVIQDDRWVAFGLDAADIYEAQEYVKTVPSEGGRCTSRAMTSEEIRMVKEAEINRVGS